MYAEILIMKNNFLEKINIGKTSGSVMVYFYSLKLAYKQVFEIFEDQQHMNVHALDF